MRVSLVQPLHNHASEDPTKPGHIYSNTSLWTAGSQLIQAGLDVDFHDENIRPAEPQGNVVGLNIVGPPYIPVVAERIRSISQGQRILLGGQTLRGLVTEDKLTGRATKRVIFDMLFGKETIYGNSSLDTSHALGMPSFPLAKATSLIPAYERVPPEDMKLYLEREMSFYLSQWCKYNCDFCQAQKKLPEEYRESDVLKKDLHWLFTRAE